LDGTVSIAVKVMMPEWYLGQHKARHAYRRKEKVIQRHQVSSRPGSNDRFDVEGCTKMEEYSCIYEMKKKSRNRLCQPRKYEQKSLLSLRFSGMIRSPYISKIAVTTRKKRPSTMP